MYVIIGSHFVPLEGKFLLIALVILRITLNVIVRQMPINNSVSIVQMFVVKLINTSTMFSQLSKCLKV
jgi:hypothetical protein